MLFLANFDPPLPLSHFVTHLGTPLPKVRHTCRPPRFLVSLVQKSWTKVRCTNSISIVRRGFCPGWFLSIPLLSQYICYNRKLNITLNFMFQMYDNNLYKRDVTCSCPPCPLSQTVTPSRTPSPLERDVGYFKDGPLCSLSISSHYALLSISLYYALASSTSPLLIMIQNSTSIMPPIPSLPRIIF